MTFATTKDAILLRRTLARPLAI
ncbi:uncharacterized protein G2W53_014065 [Senna tora]|uniref:Uncharacterized protein n=1 Tax=Senna tora TaxID=362788 RepID=A0A834U1J2_9FABA|nr:uncharacterized protein G2W53_014065 [Senna tora]